MIQKEDLARIREDRGPNDLELQIDMLKKQKEYLQKQCRRAGEAILNQGFKFDALSKEYDKVVEENNNLKTMMKA
jgi:chaperonin cofactor prefoldin